MPSFKITSELQIIDLCHLGNADVIASYYLETDKGLILFDLGPQTTYAHLKASLAAKGFSVKDIAAIALSHIHLDHAGAAGDLLEENPDILIYVSEIGAPHLIDPTRLEKSSRRVFGAEFDRLWGGVKPVPASQIRLATDLPLSLSAQSPSFMHVIPTPGHASHHVSYLLPDGTLFCGDSAGIRVSPHPFIYPVSPPPDTDIAIWHQSIAEMASYKPDRICLSHFGFHDDPSSHFAKLDGLLELWKDKVAEDISKEEFADFAHTHMPDDIIAKYDQTGPPWLSHQGLVRYLHK